MKHHSSAFRGFSAAIILMALALFWLSLAPTSFGGNASYVIVAGASMEPALHKGDLVITQRSDAYEVGEVVTYQHPELGPIIHRIIDDEGGAFTFKGDNNFWIDDFRATPENILGKEWVHVPDAAKVIQFLTTPTVVAIMSIIVAASLFGTLLSKDQNDMKRIKWIPEWDLQGVDRFIIGQTEGLFLLLGVILLASLLLGIFAFSKPLQTPVSISTPFSHEGRFDYNTNATETVYADGQVQTGDPIFREVVDEFEVTFVYSLHGEKLEEISGRARFDVQVRDIAGWNRVIQIQPWVSFDGPEASLNGTVYLHHIQELIEGLEASTGLIRTYYEIYFIPKIEMHGKVNHRVFEDSFSPSLDFQFNEIQLQLVPITDNEENNPLEPELMGQIVRSVETPNTLSILGFELLVSTARWVAFFGALIATSGLLFFTQLLVRRSREDPLINIQAHYGEYLIEVEKTPSYQGVKRVKVGGINDLVRVAQKTDQVIVYAVQGSKYTFTIRGNKELYFYEFRDSKKPAHGKQRSSSVGNNREAS